MKEAGVRFGRQLPPSYDPQITQWYANFTRRHWSGGESGLWAIEHFNEPWEPMGISGWNSDSQRYRQILKCIHDGAKSVDKRIKIAGTCSVMNTEDKLLSGDSREAMQMLDLMTDHYVSLFAAYGGRVAEKYGIVSGETETWGVHNQVLAAQFMCQFLSSGQKWLNPVKDSGLFTDSPGLDRDLTVKNTARVGVIAPTPVALSLAIWTAMIQDREFKRLAFTTHQPYLYQFGEDADARFVLCGKVTSTGSGRLQDYPWWQVLEGPVGSIVISDPGKVIECRDLSGNPLPREADGGYRLPLDTTSFYLWSAKGAAALIAAVKAGTVDGLRAVHIAPNGIRPTATGAMELPVALHNVLNRPIAGTLSATSLDTQKPLTFAATVELVVGGDTTVAIPVPAGTSGGLPLRFTFTPTAGGLAATEWTEVVQTTLISRATPADAAAWSALPAAAVMRPQGEVKGSEIEAVWLPMLQRQTVSVPTRRGEVRLAYDDQALQVYATVDAKAIRPRPRLATRNDDDYFLSDAWAERTFAALRPYKRFLVGQNGKVRGGKDRPEWVPAAGEPDYAEYKAIVEANPSLKQLIDRGTAKRWAESGDSFAQLSYIYQDNTPMINHLPFSGDAFQFAIDVDRPEEVMTRTHDLTYPAATMPAYWMGMPDSDYEFSLYQCDDGKAELWCLMAPGVPRGHYFPRQERGKVNQHAITAVCSVVNVDGRTTYSAAIPWSDLGGKPWVVGSSVGFTFAFNAADGGTIRFGAASGATKMNALTMHPYWEPKAANTIRWTMMP